MKSFIRVLSLCLLLITTLLSGCSSLNSKNKLPPSKPVNFNFVFSYGVGAKNQLDTAKGQFTKDMVIDPSITTELKLSDKNMDAIYSELKKINILAYEENFQSKGFTESTPFITYNFSFTANGIEKKITWLDKNDSITEEAVQLRELFYKIRAMIESTEEYKKLPVAKPWYK
ncbi:hypothetical protein ACPWSR_12905 [Alloiococcus sp. CFN-8]|uniref:hypothetical protein n=1 Tax=Alloiococcus sp. CFN-8 TaxID=3416081 RepID=UPI003CF515C8